MLNHHEKLAYYFATRRIDITKAIHLGALALISAGIDGYAITKQSTRIELEGIKKLLAIENVRESVYSGAVRYNIVY
jgi:hypothetical protein